MGMLRKKRESKVRQTDIIHKPFVRGVLFLLAIVLLTPTCGCAVLQSSVTPDPRKTSWDRPETQIATETETETETIADRVFEISFQSLCIQLEQQARDVLNGRLSADSIVSECYFPYDLTACGRSYCIARTENGIGSTAVCDRITEKVTSRHGYEYVLDRGTDKLERFSTIDSTSEYVVEHVIREFPAELYPVGFQNLSACAQEYLFAPLLEYDDPVPLSCFSGEDWIVIFTEEFIPYFRSVHVIYRITEDGELCEFGHHNVFSQRVTGACILSETTGFLCQTYLDGNYFRYVVSGTFDGGETWTDMGLALPEKYDDYEYATAFFPYFEGDRGIVFIGLADSLEGSDWNTTVCCFLTEDGGRTWTFRE